MVMTKQQKQQQQQQTQKQTHFIAAIPMIFSPLSDHFQNFNIGQGSRIAFYTVKFVTHVS